MPTDASRERTSGETGGNAGHDKGPHQGELANCVSGEAQTNRINQTLPASDSGCWSCLRTRRRNETRSRPVPAVVALTLSTEVEQRGGSNVDSSRTHSHERHAWTEQVSLVGRSCLLPMKQGTDRQAVPIWATRDQQETVTINHSFIFSIVNGNRERFTSKLLLKLLGQRRRGGDLLYASVVKWEGLAHDLF